MKSSSTAPDKIPSTSKTINPFLIKSWLIFPAIKERFIHKILTLKGLDKPDVVIFDLEDSIANTKEAKTMARHQIVEYLLSNSYSREAFFSNFYVAIRINNYTSQHYKKDLEVINHIQPHFVIVPKIQSEEEVILYQRKLPSVQVRFVIETIKGYDNRDEIINALRPTDLLGIGYEDLCADLGIERPNDLTQPNPLVHIINSCIISAKQHNTVFVEGPSRKYGSKKNLAHLKQECVLSRSMGFSSKLAIHPSQVHYINAIYNKDDLKKRAEEILQQFQTLNDGTYVIGNKNKEMMDTPSVNFHSKTLQLLQK